MDEVNAGIAELLASCFPFVDTAIPGEEVGPTKAPAAAASHKESYPKLPLDVFEVILFYLSARDLKAVAKVCRFLSGAVKREHAWREAHAPYVEHAFTHVLTTRFPPPKGIQINMMPILAEDLYHTVPEECRGYLEIINLCAMQTKGVIYLTIDEHEVLPGEAHRRPGLHVESPVVRPGDPLARIAKSKGEEKSLDPVFLAWGQGMIDMVTKKPLDGIYFGSNVARSSRVYRSMVTSTAMVGHDGDIGSVRHLFPRHTDLGAGDIFWMTDRTPHESFHVKKKVYRQFFRLVTGPIGVWFSKHNTPNPAGVLPNCVISDIDKFADYEST
ncbi:hypothetical protein M427DRAFT_54841 [Gonapodya prolifera JEL478]|uniref:F-box domain-containing protein n=1 Tax=Gonapodya prolifera (strain JEL478) TaxID=1344416 RepID=A0A139AL33_GONPJ|nr:hypothetical protein M427DRAFT_54841 [Gonapodya prolifera JEL478]|eukprot:KXS17193.1 hypothetical protein M427DRAFT_54841 [Gonapodya prolifera JEL478]